MNDVLDIVRAQRPDRPSLDAATRSRLRARVTGELDPDAAVGPELVLTRDGDRCAAHDPNPRRFMAVAAGVLMLAGIIGVRAIANRPGEQSPPPAQQPTTEPPSEPTLQAERTGSADPAPSGAMILEQFPAALANATGHSYVGTAAASEPPFPAGTWIQRWYTTTMDQPELHPRLKLASTSSTRQIPPEIPPAGVEATQVIVRGAAAWLYDDPAGSGRTVAFQDDETVFVLTGYQLSDDELLTAADHTTLADSSSVGAVIDSGALRADLVERAAGTTSEDPFVPLESLQHPPASVRWYNAQPNGALPSDGEPMLWLGWRVEDPDLLPLHRLDYDTVTNATVHGIPAFIATNDTPPYFGVFWSDGGYTYTLGGFGLDPDTVLEAANQLRPATDSDWTAFEAEPG